MRNAALILGIIGGIWAMFVGFFGYGYTEIIAKNAEVQSWFWQVDRPGLIRLASFLAPVLAIAGAAMARSRNLAAGVLELLAGTLLWYAFGFNVFTMFPIAMLGLGGALALAARQPDTH
jgi:predicted small integral membrane protein